MDEVPAEHLAQEDKSRPARVVSASHDHEIFRSFVGVEDESVALENLHMDNITYKQFNRWT